MDSMAQEDPVQLFDSMTATLYKLMKHNPDSGASAVLQLLLNRHEEFQQICQRRSGRGKYMGLDTVCCRLGHLFLILGLWVLLKIRLSDNELQWFSPYLFVFDCFKCRRIKGNWRFIFSDSRCCCWNWFMCCFLHQTFGILWWHLPSISLLACLVKYDILC